MKRYAIVSVYDKQGLLPFVKELCSAGYSILSTGGTAKFLLEQGVQVESVDEYIAHPEILQGRVKSLHPKIHGGILARRDNPNDIRELEKSAIGLIDIVVVNLYPFTQKVKEIEAGGIAQHGSLVEYIDIGGPTMIRAAAKNCADVVPVCDPEDYPALIEELRTNKTISLATREGLAAKVFSTMAAYDGAVARYFSLSQKLFSPEGKNTELAPVESFTLVRKFPLRYGENPHQQAGLYRRFELAGNKRKELWEVLQGKELSYNNILDMHAALDLFLDLFSDVNKTDVNKTDVNKTDVNKTDVNKTDVNKTEASKKGKDIPSVIIKHANPCGVALRNTALEAFTAARECDPLSAFGGIVVVGGLINRVTAERITEGFVEVVIFAEADADALSVFAKKKNLRLVKCDFTASLAARNLDSLTIRGFSGDILLQTGDLNLVQPQLSHVVGVVQPTEHILGELTFACSVCKHVKSNAIVIVKNRQAIGVGAGQMSRVDAARLAIQRAQLHGHDIRDAVAASDAFLPFPDTLEILADAGIVALVQPGGSVKDEEVVATANSKGVALLFTGERHFRH